MNRLRKRESNRNKSGTRQECIVVYTGKWQAASQNAAQFHTKIASFGIPDVNLNTIHYVTGDKMHTHV